MIDQAFQVYSKDSVDINASLIINDTDRNVKVLTTIQRELRRCDSFDFSVAFITRGGIATLKQILLDNQDRVKGRIITTDYLNFNDPKALRELLKFQNIEVRVYTKENFHTKGYLFHTSEETTLLVGSSNLTQDALCKTKEWNIKVSTRHDPIIIENTRSEFESMWKDSESLTEEWICNYEPRHIKSKIQRDRLLYSPDRYSDIIIPNSMQEEALQELSKLRSKGEGRALLISATGTGKTYLSAFDVKESGYHKVLFLVHREQILDDARRSYERVFGSGISTGKISGTCKDCGADVIFSTVQSMSKAEIMEHFSPDHFDYIICDEAHHSTAHTYDRILSYFKPKFMLGMTATPERMDQGDVFEQFNHNIAYEIRLQDALSKDMLCPFHYYGISDLVVDGKTIEDKEEFRSLTSDERVRHIIEKAEIYGHSGDRVHGLIFCSRKDEGREISRKMNNLGFRTEFICGEDPVNRREIAVDRLEQIEDDGALDYIITVDVFNEGVDIRSVNQIIMLRPTESATIFIQQLGRGLRKRLKNNSIKEFLVVLDFIGNYQNNFMIPMALTGDCSMDREGLRKRLMMGNSEIPGCSTVDFDPVSKERIYESINTTKSLAKLVKDTYKVLTAMLGYAPDLRYLYRNDKIDPVVIADKYGNLNEFKRKLRMDHLELSESEDRALTFVTQMFVSGMRPHELLILDGIMEDGQIDMETFEERITGYEMEFDQKSFDSAVSVLSGRFNDRLKGESLVVIDGSVVRPSGLFLGCIDDVNLRGYFEDVIECGLERFGKEYSGTYDGKFTPFKRYSRADVCRLLNWEKDESSVVYGYRVKDNTCPMFVTYHKSEDISESTQYEDAFIDRNTFSWMTRSRKTLQSEEVRTILSPDCDSYLFVKKSDDESGEFYYVGRATPILDRVRQTTIENKGEKLPIVNIPLRLAEPVPEEIYSYIVGQ